MTKERVLAEGLRGIAEVLAGRRLAKELPTGWTVREVVREWEVVLEQAAQACEQLSSRLEREERERLKKVKTTGE